MQREKLLITIPVKCTCDINKGGGTLHITFDLTDVEKDNKECIGQIAGCLGGGVELTHKALSPGKTWFVSPKDLWDAFVDALAKRKVEG